MEALPHGRQGQPRNAYLPHRVLLAQCELFLGHYRCSSLHLSQGLRECRGAAQSSLLLEVQLLCNLGELPTCTLQTHTDTCTYRGRHRHTQACVHTHTNTHIKLLYMCLCGHWLHICLSVEFPNKDPSYFSNGVLSFPLPSLPSEGAASKAHSVDDAKLVDAVGHLQASLWLAEAASLCSQSNSLHR